MDHGMFLQIFATVMRHLNCEVTISQNKTLSDDSDPLLALQGISWFLRKAIALSTVTLQVTEYVEDSLTHIDIDQTATGGIKGTSEKRCLDFVERPHKDGIFGSVEAKSRWIKLDDLDVKDPDEAKFLKGEGYGGGFLGGDDEGEEGKRHIQSLATNVDGGSSGGWTAEQVWHAQFFSC